MFLGSDKLTVWWVDWHPDFVDHELVYLQVD